MPVSDDVPGAAAPYEEKIAWLFRPNSLALRPEDAAFLSECPTFRFGPDLSRLGWSIGEGPLVVLAHGWAGLGVQMAPIARALADRGFRCAFYDCGGHGQSRIEPINFVTIINDFTAVLEHLGEPARAWIGHSAGGQGMMAARAMHGVAATDSYVCISTPTAPYVPINVLRDRVAAPAVEIEAAKALFAEHFGCAWPDMETGALYRPEPCRRLMLVHDRSDPIVRHEDAEVIARGWETAQILKTDGLGHNRALRDKATVEAICCFILSAQSS